MEKDFYNILNKEKRVEGEKPRFFSSKGQQQVITAIILTGVLIGIVGTIYLWGVPLVQKNKDVTLLQSSEDFMKSLDEKIKNIANTGGREQMKITLPVVVETEYDNSYKSWTVKLNIETQGSIYAVGGDIPLKNATCAASKGTWGSDEPGVLCVSSRKLGENQYSTTYKLRYIRLDTTITRSYKISMNSDGPKSYGADHAIIIENAGTTEVEEVIDGVETKVTITKVNIGFV